MLWRSMPRLFVLLAGLLALSPVAHANTPDAVGGGYTDSGLLGHYFANESFDGEATFVRRDVRLAFSWGTGRPVGGSPAEPYRSFPTDGFSVRWQGRFVPRFSEPYRFLGESQGKLVVRFRREGDADWATLVDARPAGRFESEPTVLESGVLYEIVVEYVAASASPALTLAWTSPSTPREVIDPVTQQGLNAATFATYIWANAMKTARYGQQGDSVDDRGWPTRSGTELILAEMSPDDPQLGGAYLVRFEGKAKVRQSCCGQLTFVTDEVPRGNVIPSGGGYDAKTNETTATMLVPGSRTMLFLDEASRGKGRGEGVTGIRFMRPLKPGSDRHHRLDEIVYRPFKQLLQDDFTTIRWLEGANMMTESDWDDRSRPDDAFFNNAMGQENWEYLVILANETGKDLVLTTPIAANDEYFDKLARLLRYGSDGVEPYRTETKNPRYPPLNSNLRVYVEVGNEIWNWPFPSTALAQRLAKEEAEEGTPTWSAMNFDGMLDDPGSIHSVRRWHGFRTIKASNAFRSVWGDDSMGSRVRVLLQYQYDDFQVTASTSLFFIDEYFGVPRPGFPEAHPVSYYVWGAGGATYYGLANNTGNQTATALRDASFEDTRVPADKRVFRPAGSAWTFRGRSGVVRPTEPGDIDELENVAEPIDGEQYAFLLAGGSISQEVRFDRPGEYALSFKAAGPGTAWPGHLPFDIYVDDTKVSPRSQSEVRVADGEWFLGGWSRKIDNLEEEWGSAVFRVDTPGMRTIRFVGGKGAGHLLLDNVRVASTDAILESGFDVGTAQGQEGTPDLNYQFRSQARYARTFGLQVVAYEAGWSLGGDFHQVPIQNWAKLRDPRARAINDAVIKLWDESGSFMSVWGVYKYFTVYDLEGASSYPVMQSFRSASQQLRAEPTYGEELPATLNPDDAAWSHEYETPSDDQAWWCRYVPWLSCGTDAKWLSWMLVSPATQSYTVRVNASGEGSVRVELDGAEVMKETPVGSLPAGIRVDLTKGAHAIRVIQVGKPVLQSVEIVGGR